MFVGVASLASRHHEEEQFLGVKQMICISKILHTDVAILLGSKLLAESIEDPHQDFLRRNSTRYLFRKRYLSPFFVWWSMWFDGQIRRAHGDARTSIALQKIGRTVDDIWLFLIRRRCSYIIWFCHDSTYTKSYVPSKSSDGLVVCGHFKRAKLAKKLDPLNTHIW